MWELHWYGLLLITKPIFPKYFMANQPKANCLLVSAALYSTFRANECQGTI